MKDCIGYAILNGHEVIPTSFEEWVQWSSKGFKAPKRIAQDFFNDNQVNVSTVFLGIDHGFFGNKSLWFETMVFGGPMNGYQDRYESWEEAMEGHRLTCQAVSVALKL